MKNKMKHLVLYNKFEYINELKTSTYLSAANKLSNLNHQDRADQLIKHAKSKSSLVNIFIENLNVAFETTLESVRFNVKYNQHNNNNFNINVFEISDDKMFVINDIDEYKILQDWLDSPKDCDNDFCFEYCFEFKVLESGSEFNNFKISLVIDLGLDEYGYGYYNFNGVKYPSFYNGKQTHFADSSFSFYDRKSAINFKKSLVDLVKKSETYIQRVLDNDYFKRLNYNDILNLAKNISVNKIYNESGNINFDFSIDV